MMERVSLHQLVILLAFFLLVNSSDAIPSTRAQRMLQYTLDFQGSSYITESKDEVVFFGRMDIESNDYPGSGANNRHTPKPPGRKLK